MRLGVIDIGSNSVHLLVVDAHPGAQPLPAFSHKTELRLSESLDPDGRVSDATAERLVAFIRECLVVAEDQGVSDLFAFATSALRESPNGEAVIGRVRDETGVELEALSGSDEARMTFLAVRRWFGWSSGRPPRRRHRRRLARARGRSRRGAGRGVQPAAGGGAPDP